METKEAVKDYLNKCQHLQMNATYESFTIRVNPLGFEVTLFIRDKKEPLLRNYFFRFRKNSSERVLEDEYGLLLLALENNIL